jgi:hypothetical protein
MMATSFADLGGCNRYAQGADGLFALREAFERAGQTVATTCAAGTLRQVYGTFTMSGGSVPSASEVCRVESVVRIQALQRGERSSFGELGQ